MAALIDRVDARDLRLVGRGRQREVRVAARVGEYLHLGVNAAVAPARRVRQRPVAVDEGVLRLGRAVLARKTLVLFGQRVAELDERAAEVRSVVRRFDAVVQVDFDLTEAFGLQFGHAPEYARV